MFSFPLLLWFLPLVGLVVLIHLINMFRHRRVEWGAMEFLLAGYRKSRTRILFQQLLLMLLRALAVAAIILMLAQPKLEGPLADWIGGKPTHHLIFLDDSYSMNDRNAAQGGTPLFDDAREIIRQIVETAAKKKTNDRLTLVRFSKAARVLNGNEPDIGELPLDSNGLSVVENLLSTLNPSQADTDWEKSLQAATTLLQQSTIRLKPIIYFLSDFRNRDWSNPVPVQKQLEELRRLGSMIRMVRMTDEERPNLTISSLSLVPGIHAANIDLLLDATVVNHGRDDVENVPLLISVDGRSQPNQTIPKIKAGEPTSPPIRFPIRLEGTGNHRVEVQLQPDSVPDDNHRFLVVDVPQELNVLLIVPNNRIGSSESTAQYVRVALSPGGTKSGIRTRVEPPSFLASTPLDSFSAIFLLDLPPLDASVLRALELYVQRGGGLAMFPGPDTDLAFVKDDLYKNGAGLFPLSPITESPLEPDFLSKKPDLNVSPHPIFRLFGEGESPLLGNVKIDRFLAVAKESSPTDDVPMHVLATLRNGAPLVVEKTFGKGKTITFLTTASPLWNNWARGNPSFVVVMLELAAWLSERPQTETDFQIGASVPLSFDGSLFETKVQIQTPPKRNESVGTVATRDAHPDADGDSSVTWTATELSGIYEATLQKRSGGEEKRCFAVNVNPAEGEMQLIEAGTLSVLLRSIGVSLESAAGFSAPQDFSGSHSLGELFLLLVVCLLLGETFLAGRILPPISRK